MKNTNTLHVIILLWIFGYRCLVFCYPLAEVEVNDPFTENENLKGVIELDIKPDPQQDVRQRRAVSTDLRHKWTNGVVPFEFTTVTDKLLSQSAIQEIQKAIKNIESQTCIKFVRRTNEKHYVIFAKGLGCSSYIGNIQSSTGQEISIGQYCIDLSVIVHEILHALGFIHEHTRLDRDSYIHINSSNIRAGAEEQFKIYTYRRNIREISTLDTRYDKSSVMHYKRFTFTNKADPVTRLVLPIKEHMTMFSLTNSNEVLGSNNGLSAMDVVRINKHYNCLFTPLIPKVTPAITTTTTTTTTKTTTTTAKTTTKATTTTKSSTTILIPDIQGVSSTETTPVTTETSSLQTDSKPTTNKNGLDLGSSSCNIKSQISLFLSLNILIVLFKVI